MQAQTEAFSRTGKAAINEEARLLNQSSKIGTAYEIFCHART
jgi:hypothetical protein